ncbi:TPA: hypothetical protein N0F65_010485 [Lagenidium giganteum]|uniref:Uncharacterized protein n=1 Tax=Lagenidium giganteum TaxID=4803 RepID=A0AAV2ZDH9_9STRA|nr:TPA: hypothetical protein N0F65_010485 [Lagenidium giganteum]
MFGVDRNYFWAVHMLREAIEVVAQVVQAYNASVLVSHSYMNHLLVVMLVLNSWSTPAIHYVAQ